MNNKFFPHQGGGSINTKQTYDAPYNYQPDQPVALDSRAVISEWSDDALKSMTNNDIYAGMQIYCLADKKIEFADGFLEKENILVYIAFGMLYIQVMKMRGLILEKWNLNSQ